MGTQLEKKHNEIREKMKKYDEIILKLLRQGHKDLVAQIIKDYLSSYE